jgi:hypothetical protein
LIVALSQQRKEEEMRKREAKIAVMDRAFEIYNFFTREIINTGFFLDRSAENLIKSYNRVADICFKADMIFRYETCNKLSELMKNILSMLRSGEYPNLPDDFDRNSIRGETDEDKKINYFYYVYVKNTINDIFEEYRLKL